MRLAVLFLIVATMGATDAVDDFGLPEWIIPGILMVETRSHYNGDGSIAVGDRRTGRAGELGCAQITHTAFNTVAQRGETFGRLATDTDYCERIAARYLWWIYFHTASRNWEVAIEQYNCGPHVNRAGRRYLARIKLITKDIRN